LWFNSNTTDVISGGVTANPSEAPEFTPILVSLVV
jgi:hypothetical protein